jgi:hypothetical protein
MKLRPSPSTVVASLALFVALGGTGYAVTSLPVGSVGTAQLKANAVVSSKVLNGSLLAVDFKKGQLRAGSRGATGPAGPAGRTGVAGPAGPAGAAGSSVTSTLGGDLTGTLPTATIAANAVTSTKIADNAVTNTKIADGSVTTTKIADANVQTAKIADAAVTTAKLADTGVSTAKLADAAVTIAKLASLPGVGVATSTTQSIPNSTLTALTYATGDEVFNTDTNHSGTTNPSRLTATTAGVYLVCASATWAAGINDRLIQLKQDGTTALASSEISSGNTFGDDSSVCTVVKLAATHYVEVYVEQNSGGALNVAGSRASMIWLAKGT